MFLFIFESIGTSELMLIGVIALVFLGPRRLPEIAKKIGKIMSEFRGTANEFKETWQKEVNFEEEAKALNINELESESVSRAESIPTPDMKPEAKAPAIKEIDPAKFEELKAAAKSQATVPPTEDPNDKKNWL